MVGHRPLALVAVAAVVFAACGGGSDGVSTSATTPDAGVTGSVAPGEGVIVSPDGTEVISDDGRLTLSFPAGAVTNDVAVVVEAVPTEEWPAVMADLDPAAIVYRLEPSGLSFDEPVAFGMTVDIEIGDDGSVAAPLAVVIDDAGTGELVGLDVDLDLDAGIAVVTGTIGHFSYIVAQSGALSIGLEQISPKERMVGVAWEADALVISSSDTDMIVTQAQFDDLDPVAVVGRRIHNGFTLRSNEVRTLDGPAPRWKCTDEGRGSYWVTVSAAVGEGLLIQGVNFLKSFPGFDIVPLDIAAEYRVTAFVTVTCVMPVHDASTRSGDIVISGRVTDVLASFTLNGTFEGGTATLSYQGTGTVDPDTGTVSVSGSFTYTGSGSGVTISGGGGYTIEGTLGQTLTLSQSGSGCANPGSCAEKSGEIALTPVLP